MRLVFPTLSIALISGSLALSAATPAQHKSTRSTSSHAAATHAIAHTSATRSHTSAKRVSTHTSTRSKTSHAKPATKSITRAPMDTERATAIQTALIKAGYLSGEPTGTWDAESMAAIQKLQSDNGWQTKIVPDSRALIKLGLGPNAPN